MKNLYLLLFALCCAFVSCSKKNTAIDPIPITETEKIPVDSFVVDFDLALKKSLIESGIISESQDGKVRYVDIKNIDSLNLSVEGHGNNMKGLEYFTNLRYLKIRGQQNATNLTNRYYYAFPGFLVDSYVAPIDTLDVSKNLKLEYLDCSGDSDLGGYRSSIRNLVLGQNTLLTTLLANLCMIKSLDISGLVNLQNLEMAGCFSILTMRICNNQKLNKVNSPHVKVLFLSSYNQINTKWNLDQPTYLLCK